MELPIHNLTNVPFTNQNSTEIKVLFSFELCYILYISFKREPVAPSEADVRSHLQDVQLFVSRFECLLGRLNCLGFCVRILAAEPQFASPLDTLFVLQITSPPPKCSYKHPDKRACLRAISTENSYEWLL